MISRSATGMATVRVRWFCRFSTGVLRLVYRRRGAYARSARDSSTVREPLIDGVEASCIQTVGVDERTRIPLRFAPFHPGYALRFTTST